MARAGAAAVVGSILMIGCSLAFGPNASQKSMLRAGERLALLRRAQVWTHTDVAAMDILAGPRENGFAPGSTIDCKFSDRKFGGRTPKFGCELKHDDVLKVRYGRDNGELYAGVAATRLLWALGFGADAMYPVHVLCRDCPRRLASEGTVVPEGIRFDVAAIERKFPGHDIALRGATPGWSWEELDMVDARDGGAPVAERDALKLLAVFIQHTDNKFEQQRLVCRTKAESHELAACPDPFMLIHDVGQTFGRANLLNRSAVGSVNLDLWSKTPIWKDSARCVGNLATSQTGTLSDPVISEAGRKFLADLLGRLTDKQVRDLFTVARFADKPHGGGPVDAWIAAFNHKRDEIKSTTCRN